MAAYVNSLLNKGSDTVQDYCCTACEERNIIIDAVSYCKRCAKYFCDKCNTPHKTLYEHHSVLGRGDLDKWPVAKVTVDIVEKCLEHPEEKIKLFCYGHGQICCNTCVSLNHRTCGEVKLITDSGTIPKSKKLS
ncbi:hypothetical protein DPMN_037899 [Dreissena polymorpha]|uniref:B box-type domain-containing protein n=1 Tax=Dreissena polymorpha TaxID=45954 RepID=A0A9D4RPM8_DREPO|nr:hypothetical protein DPMN_037899 [Dreissena polymorpha]